MCYCTALFPSPCSVIVHFHLTSAIGYLYHRNGAFKKVIFLCVFLLSLWGNVEIPLWFSLRSSFNLKLSYVIKNVGNCSTIVFPLLSIHLVWGIQAEVRNPPETVESTETYHPGPTWNLGQRGMIRCWVCKTHRQGDSLQQSANYQWAVTLFCIRRITLWHQNTHDFLMPCLPTYCQYTTSQDGSLRKKIK